jgi:pimeloyl-ACP methyl ester carboxylesterase
MHIYIYTYICTHIFIVTFHCSRKEMTINDRLIPRRYYSSKVISFTWMMCSLAFIYSACVFVFTYRSLYVLFTLITRPHRILCPLNLYSVDPYNNDKNSTAACDNKHNTKVDTQIDILEKHMTLETVYNCRQQLSLSGHALKNPSIPISYWNCLDQCIGAEFSTSETNMSIYYRFRNVKSIEFVGANPNASPIIFVHGANSSADVWVHTIPYLIEHSSHLYIVNLPGFGRTPLPRKFYLAPGEEVDDNNDNCKFVPSSSDEIVEMLTTFLYLYVKSWQIESPVLVGHSFGAYICAETVHKYPDMFKSLIMVSPAGFFRHTGPIGAMLGVCFKIGLLTNFAKLSKRVNIAYQRAKCTNNNAVVLYDIMCLANTPNIEKCRPLISKFIDVTPTSVQWARPIYQKIFDIQIPCASIYGYIDQIAPWYCCGDIVHEKTNIPYVNMDHCSHSPMVERPIEFAEKLLQMIKNAKVPKQCKSYLVHLQNICETYDWKTSYSPIAAKNMLTRFRRYAETRQQQK